MQRNKKNHHAISSFCGNIDNKKNKSLQYRVFFCFSISSAKASAKIRKKDTSNTTEILANKSESIDRYLSLRFRQLWSLPICAANHLTKRRCVFKWRLISWHISISKSIKKVRYCSFDCLFKKLTYLDDVSEFINEADIQIGKRIETQIKIMSLRFMVIVRSILGLITITNCQEITMCQNI